MLKILNDEIKTVETLEEVEAVLRTRGWGPGLIEEQKIVWAEFKKTGLGAIEIGYDPIAKTQFVVKAAVVEPVVVAETLAAESVAPVVPAKAGK